MKALYFLDRNLVVQIVLNKFNAINFPFLIALYIYFTHSFLNAMFHYRPKYASAIN